MLARIDDTSLDTGSHKAGSERLCALTREVKPVEQLMRFVVAPDGAVVADVKRKLPGRGLWISGTRAALAEATRRKIFARSFKREVRVPNDLAEATEQALERSVLDSLAIAAKAGHVVAGFVRVETAIARERIAAILHARDGAADGIRKLNSALRNRLAADDGVKVVTLNDFTAAQLDLAMGRSNVVHAALLAGPASEGLLARYSRLVRFRTADAEQPEPAGTPQSGPEQTGKPEGLDSE
jgi:uncharacterized protein